MADPTTKWAHSRTITESDPFQINGIKIWNPEWINTGKTIVVKDPLYGQDFNFVIYEIAATI